MRLVKDIRNKTSSVMVLVLVLSMEDIQERKEDLLEDMQQQLVLEDTLEPLVELILLITLDQEVVISVRQDLQRELTILELVLRA